MQEEGRKDAVVLLKPLARELVRGALRDGQDVTLDVAEDRLVLYPLVLLIGCGIRVLAMAAVHRFTGPACS